MALSAKLGKKKKKMAKTGMKKRQILMSAKIAEDGLASKLVNCAKR